MEKLPRPANHAYGSVGTLVGVRGGSLVSCDHVGRGFGAWEALMDRRFLAGLGNQPPCRFPPTTSYPGMPNLGREHAAESAYVFSTRSMLPKGKQGQESWVRRSLFDGEASSWVGNATVRPTRWREMVVGDR